MAAAGLSITVWCTCEASRERAEALAEQLSAPLVCATSPCGSDDCRMERGRLCLKVSEAGLALACGGMELVPDFSEMKPRLKQGALQRELLVKAARVKGVEAPTAIDATAGLGEDSLLLAAAGFAVTLCESDPVIATLLRDALRRATDDVQLAPIVARMQVVEGDSKDVLRDLSAAPDVVYLDPMFPERSKSAAVKKKFQLIHHLEQPSDPREEELLLKAALAACPRKVVVKRPIKGDCLAGVKPSHSITGKAVRYDCLVPPR